MTLCTNYLLLLGFFILCLLIAFKFKYLLFIYFFVYCQLCEWKRYAMHPVYVSLISHESGLHTLNVSMRLWHCDHCLFFKFWDLPLFICLYIYLIYIIVRHVTRFYLAKALLQSYDIHLFSLWILYNF